MQIQNEVRNEDKVGELVIKHLNLSSFSSVRKCAEEINLKEENLHFLINNAGKFQKVVKTVFIKHSLCYFSMLIQCFINNLMQIKVNH